MELPPPTDVLLDSFSIILTRSIDDLRYAQWAIVKREEYMTIARQRKNECATFEHVTLRDDLAETRLPEDDIPEHISCCTQYVDGADKAPVRMSGPADRAPEVGKNDEAGQSFNFESQSQTKILCFRRIILMMNLTCSKTLVLTMCRAC